MSVTLGNLASQNPAADGLGLYSSDKMESVGVMLDETVVLAVRLVVIITKNVRYIVISSSQSGHTEESRSDNKA